ncbi:uncharacterized protein [Palaemon carinicauda]|uniref:uncharacterized protein n=1 Tax=Palaemon carinicauda TaxID=392227 RepID=UPI0035B5999D
MLQRLMKKKNALLVSLGTEVFSVLGNLCAPDLPHTKSYGELVQLLEGHFIIKPSYHRSLIAFQQRKKKRKDESVKELYADLKALAKHCSFGNQFDSIIRDQLFMAVDAELYLSNLVALNIDLQAMTSQAILERILNMEKAFVCEKEEVQSQVQSHVQVVRRKYVGLSCQHCGFSHDSFYCRFKHLSCNNCHKKGHLQRVCKAKRESGYSTARGSNQLSKKDFNSKPKFNNRKTVKMVEGQDVSLSDDNEDDKLLTVRDKIYAVHAEQFYFSAYDDFNIKVLGKVITPVVYNGYEVSQVFYVVGSNNTNLCGKNLMKHVGIYLAGLDESTKVNNVHNVSVEQVFEDYKENKKEIRICADYKHLNKQIQCDKYPLPKIDELLCSVGKGKIFSKIDLKNAYLQIPAEEQSQEFLVINTHKGMYKYKRLPFGLSSSPAIFQRFISQILCNIDGVAAYMDDIVVSGENTDEHDERLKRVLKVLQLYNVQINKSKTVLNMECIEYLGYCISKEGIKPSPKKKGARFKWTKVEQKAFKCLRQDFDGSYPLIVEVDASPVGVGCVLLQKVHGVERPIYFASKKLSSAEMKYSQLDKEGLSLIFAVKRLRYFLLGRKFMARTDHKPLIGLFGKDKPIPQNANSRIQRWALLLSQNDFDLVYKPGKENVIADALSRLLVEDEIQSEIPAEYVRLV